MSDLFLFLTLASTDFLLSSYVLILLLTPTTAILTITGNITESDRKKGQVLDTLKVERERGERVYLAIFLQNVRQSGKFVKETTVVMSVKIELHK